MVKISVNKIKSPILLKGDSCTAYRDPAAVYHKGVFYLYYTYVKTEPDGQVYLYTAMSKSKNLVDWTESKILTPRDKSINFSSPGNIVRHKDRWVMCLQTYCRPNGEKYATEDARIWIRKSEDLENWDEPELLRVKGKDVNVEGMGRMIDPYLLEDKEEKGKWWCFYKQNGVSMSFSYDLENWNYYGSSNCGENVCVLTEGKEYILFHSPENGIGVMRSQDLKTWIHSDEIITLGQENWEWAKGRLTAGFVLDCRNEPDVGKYLMFFHGTGPEDESVFFDTHACIGLAWSDDLIHWDWPGK